jgi:flagella basal body P-ring formation protein FlgA
VTVTAQVSHVVAKRDIAPGQRIEPDDIGIETREEFPTQQPVAASARAVTASAGAVAASPQAAAASAGAASASPQPAAASAGAVTGKSSRVAIHAGAVIRPEILESFKDVRQGDIVEVEVQEGSAHLKFEARAEAPGSVGDAIPVRNPASGKRFVAKVQSKGHVFVDGSAAKDNL